MNEPLDLIWAVLESPEPIIANSAWQRLSKADRALLDSVGLLKRHTLNEIQCPVCSDGHRSPVDEADCPSGEIQYSIECPAELRIIIEQEQRVTRRIEPKRVAESIACSLELTGEMGSVSGDLLYFCGYYECRSIRVEVYFARGLQQNNGVGLAKLLPHSVLPKVVYTPLFRPDQSSWDQDIPLHVIPLRSAACLDRGILVLDFALFESIAKSLVGQNADPEYMFMKCGDFWDICFDGSKVLHIKDSVGMVYIARVLYEPNISLPVVALVAARIGIDPVQTRGTSGLRVDGQAKSEYKAEYEMLIESRGIAQQTNDQAGLERVTEQLNDMATELSRSLNLSGKSREDSDHEKIRISVTNAINRSISHIQKIDPDFGRHLKSCIQTGSDVIYTPEIEIEWVI